MNDISRRAALGALTIGAASTVVFGFDPTAPSLVVEAQAKAQAHANLSPREQMAADEEEELAWDQRRRYFLELGASDD